MMNGFCGSGRKLNGDAYPITIRLNSYDTYKLYAIRGENITQDLM